MRKHFGKILLAFIFVATLFLWVRNEPVNPAVQAEGQRAWMDELNQASMEATDAGLLGSSSSGPGTGTGTGGSSSSTLINGLNSTTFTITASSTAGVPYTLSTSAPSSLVLNLPRPPYITVCDTGCDYTATGTNDQVGINTGFQANSTTFGSLFVKHGNYTNTNTTSTAATNRINVPSNMTLQGEGDGTVFNAGTNANTIMGVDTASNVNLKDFAINGGGLNPVAFGNQKSIRILNSSNVKISNTTQTNVNGFGAFIFNSNGSNNSTSQITLLNNYWQCNGYQDCVGGGMPDSSGIGTTSDISVLANHIVQDVSIAGTENVDFETNCFDITPVLRVMFGQNNCWGDVIFGSEQSPAQWSKITDNIISPNKGTSLVSGDVFISQPLANATRTPTNMIVGGNLITSGGIKIKGATGFPIQHLMINGNSVQSGSPSEVNLGNFGHHGIYEATTTTGLIYGNDLRAYPGSTSTTGILLTNVSSTTVAFNTISDFPTGIDFGGNSSSVTGCKGNKSIFNSFSPNVTTPITGCANIIGMDELGNVVIGTTTPGFRLDIFNPSGTNTFRAVNLQAAGSGAGAGLVADTITPTAADNRLGFLLFGAMSTSSVSSSINAAGLSAFSSEAWAPGANQGAYLKFETTATASTTRAERLRITANGNVGIGTTTPATVLGVAGANASIRIGQPTTANTGCIEIYDSVNTTTLEYIYTVSGTLTATTTKPNFCQ